MKNKKFPVFQNCGSEYKHLTRKLLIISWFVPSRIRKLGRGRGLYVQWTAKELGFERQVGQGDSRPLYN